MPLFQPLLNVLLVVLVLVLNVQLLSYTLLVDRMLQLLLVTLLESRDNVDGVMLLPTLVSMKSILKISFHQLPLPDFSKVLLFGLLPLLVPWFLLMILLKLLPNKSLSLLLQVPVVNLVKPPRNPPKVNPSNSPLNLQYLLLKNNLLCGMMSLQVVSKTGKSLQFQLTPLNVLAVLTLGSLLSLENLVVVE